MPDLATLFCSCKTLLFWQINGWLLLLLLLFVTLQLNSPQGGHLFRVDSRSWWRMCPAVENVHCVRNSLQFRVDFLQQKISFPRFTGSGHIDFNEFLVMMSHTKEKGAQAELRQAFSLFDSDGDGFITFEDLKRVMRNCGESLSDSELKHMFTKADVNRDNLVDLKGK